MVSVYDRSENGTATIPCDHRLSSKYLSTFSIILYYLSTIRMIYSVNQVLFVQRSE